MDEEIKTSSFKVLKKEENSAIVNIEGWRMRVYFDGILTEDEKAKIIKGKNILIDYVGDLADVFSVQLQPLITVE